MATAVCGDAESGSGASLQAVPRLRSIGTVATTAGIWRFGLGQRKTLRHRCRPNRQSDRRLRNRTLGFRLEKVSGKAPTLRLDSFCHRDQSRSGGRGKLWKPASWFSPPNPKGLHLPPNRKPPPREHTSACFPAHLLTPFRPSAKHANTPPTK